MGGDAMPVKRLSLLALLLALAMIAYMTIGSRGNWDFVLAFRGAKLLAIIAVGVAVSTSTLLFQTIAQNRILTPSIMGFDALYVLIITMMVFFVGGQGMLSLGPYGLFAMNTLLLLLASFLLFGTLIFEHGRDLTRMILTGVILGTLFRSLTSFATRMIDPNEYAHIQIASYASFNSFDMELLYIGVAIIIACLAFVWTIRHRLDVISLGYDVAINLGENVRAVQLLALAVIAILVSVSTALVGPVAFLGLLVVSIAHLVTPSPYHSTLLLSSALISCLILVGGQTLMERVLQMSTPLAVVIDFVGGLVFLLLLLQRLKK
ncbi:putative ABC transporter permease protein YclO [Maritalea myrionectae]|uniref:Putative ABC transporter permease protein YclO n=2 Tax=Maritalea myrionectae TaxID=454601 RepID=A0A2R4MBP0_9HYPH|nr:putative ABC transporter permease protein YclO [Maritalea myrionectae]